MKSEIKEEPKEQFIYPKHPLLRRAYQGIITKVFDTRKVVFRPTELIMAIIDHLGWEDDSGMDSYEKKPGPRYKKAKNILRSFEGNFVKFSGSSLEVYIFKLDKNRVQSFIELESLCEIDTDMSELIATTEKLDLTQPWCDVRVSNPVYPISSEITTIDSILEENKSIILKEKKRKMGKRHDGIVKGTELKTNPYNIPDSIGNEDGNEDIEGADSLQDEE